MKLIDMAGFRAKHAVVLYKGPPRKGGGSDWVCLCDCGREFVAIGSNLRQGHTTSCGCAARAAASRMGSNPEFTKRRIEKIVTHGHKRRGVASAEYKTWLGMKRRCNSPSSKDYPNWGGRGIRVCDRWETSFEAFLADMGTKPTPQHSIDRIDPNGNYEPGNCRWATLQEQGAENCRSNIAVVVRGVEYPTIAAAAKAFGVRPSAAYQRIKAGIAPDLAVTITGRMKPRRTRESYIRRDLRG